MAATTETTKTLVFGAGVDCNALIADNLGPADFPKKITLENNVDFAVHVGGIRLAPCYDDAKTKTVEIKTYDELQRLASDAHAVGEINAKPELVTISFVVGETPVETSVTTSKQKKTTAPESASE